MPATIPTTAPLISLVTFSITSVLASSISSRMSSDALSVTSWIACPRSDVSVSLAMSVEDALEDAGDEERAHEGGAHEYLWALGGGRQLVDAGQAGDGGGGRGRLGSVRLAHRSLRALAIGLGLQPLRPLA